MRFLMPEASDTTSQKPTKDTFSANTSTAADKSKTANPRAASTRGAVKSATTEQTDALEGNPSAIALEPSDLLETPTQNVKHLTSDFNGLLTKIQAFQEEMWRTTRLAFEKLSSELSDECEDVLVKLDTRLQERTRRQMSLISDAFEIEAESRLAARVDQAVEKVLVVERRVLNALEERVEAGKAALDRLRQAASEELDQRKASGLEHFQAETSKRLEAIKSVHETDLKNLADNQTGVLKEQLSKITATALEAFADAVRARTEQVSSQFESRFTSMGNDALSRLSIEAESIVKREASSHLIQVLRSRLDQLAISLKE